MQTHPLCGSAARALALGSYTPRWGLAVAMARVPDDMAWDAGDAASADAVLGVTATDSTATSDVR